MQNPLASKIDEDQFQGFKMPDLGDMDDDLLNLEGLDKEEVKLNELHSS